MRQTARTAGSVAVLALLVCACVFAALTGPAVSLRTRTQALSQTLAAAGPIIKTVQVDAPWDQFAAATNLDNQGYFGLGQAANLTPSQFAETQREIGRGLAHLPLPLGAGAWAGLASHLLPVAAGAGPLAFIGVNSPPMMEVVYRNALPAFALVLALSLAAFAGMVSQAITRGEVAASWQATGADVAITATSSPVTPAAEKAIAAVRGVRHLTATWNTGWATPSDQPVALVAVDPASSAALVASTPFPAVPVTKARQRGARHGGRARLPGRAGRPGRDGGPAHLAGGHGADRGAGRGHGDEHPREPAGSAFLVMKIQRLPGPLGVPAVNRILITGSGISSAAMSAVILRQLPGASTAFRSEALAALAGSPLQHGADLILPLTIVTAAGFGLFILMLGVALGTSDRALTLARLTVMGHERATRLVLLEALPAVVVAVAAGAACALALPPLVGSALDLSVFTGPGIPVMVRPDWISLGVPAMAALLLAVAALATEARRLSRRGVDRMLRAE